ncbi:MAG: alpha/beta hydrolase [Sphingomonadaceae bacterium]|nr:alpha/beta hydrolase [Sphingomonadaceae bacterium]
MNTQIIRSFDDVELVVHRLGPKHGGGRPVLLLHGLFSSADVNWIKFGHAQRLADAGFEAIMPDLRTHGQSDVPQDPGAYPADVLVKDALALADGLGLEDFDLVGFSLGARTSVQAVLAGLVPRRLVLGGMGIEGLGQWARRSAFFVDAIDRYDEIRSPDDPAFMAKSFMRTMKVDRAAARLLLQSVQDTREDALAQISMPTLVVCGAQDQDNGNGPALADALPDGTYCEVPGNHMSSVTEPAFGEAIADFLKA